MQLWWLEKNANLSTSLPRTIFFTSYSVFTVCRNWQKRTEHTNRKTGMTTQNPAKTYCDACTSNHLLCLLQAQPILSSTKNVARSRRSSSKENHSSRQIYLSIYLTNKPMNAVCISSIAICRRANWSTDLCPFPLHWKATYQSLRISNE